MRRSGYLLLITVVLGLLSGAADSLCQQQQPGRKALPTLTTAHDAHSLTSEQSARRYPVHLRTVVTYYDPYVDPRHPTVWVSPRELADVIGFPIIGAFTPALTSASYEAAGFQQSVATVAITTDQALRGNHGAELVELEGQLVGQEESASAPNIVLSSQNHVFSAVLPAYSGARLPIWEKGTTFKILRIRSMKKRHRQDWHHSGRPFNP